MGGVAESGARTAARKRRPFGVAAKVFSVPSDARSISKGSSIGNSRGGAPTSTPGDPAWNVTAVTHLSLDTYTISLPTSVHCGIVPPDIETRRRGSPEGELATHTSGWPDS